MAMSLAQGGSGFPYFASCIYQYLQGVSLQEVSVRIDDVADYDVRVLLEKVILSCTCTDQLHNTLMSHLHQDTSELNCSTLGCIISLGCVLKAENEN